MLWMNYQASNPESLSEAPERLSETKTRSGSPPAAAKKWAAEVLTSCTNLNSYIAWLWGETVQFARESPGSDVIHRGSDRFTHYQTLYQSLPELCSSERGIERDRREVMVIGNVRGENYNFSNGQEINHKAWNEGKKQNTKGSHSK